ncbi:MAG: 3-hydroxyacyl-CoA dehydrogenase [Gammaproteobacteria bacterium]|nr:MAG: 3-hydroxyacyl-CoA dehydrogenase [Gammaproteobacteria bacterium]
MTQAKLNNLTVIGAGVLGGQIAWQSAFRGKNVVVYDLYEEGLEKCRTAHQTYSHIYTQDLGATENDIQETRGRLAFSTDLQQAVADADIVIEAAPEIPDVKTSLYQEMANYLPDRTLLATNSSTLLPSQFAEATGRPDKFCALHFANLIWSMNIGEIMAHQGTSEQTLIDVTRFAIEIGMVPIPVGKEQNGYVLNSMMVPLAHAAQSLITNGVSTPEYVDRTYMIMNRGCSLGPCGLIDVVGFKTMYDVFSHWGEVKKDDQMLANAQYLKEHFLDKGLLGLQTNQGYYQYPNPSYQAADFLDVPDISKAKELALLAKL